jgi:ATP-binding cassette subfamily F protein 3
MKRSTKLDVAYFAQHQLDELRENATPFILVGERMRGEPESRIRSRCARLGFGSNKADTPVENLSGGEKARLLMGLAAFNSPHLLILDEPTNHLDIDSRTALMEAINDYEGAVILVSHDRFLIEACAERLWIVGNGAVKNFDGDMDDYRRFVLSGEAEPTVKARPEEERAAKNEDRKAAAERRQAAAPLRKKLHNLEIRIDKLGTAIKKIDSALSGGRAYEENAAKASELARMRAEAAVALESAEEEWLEVSGALEAAEV